MNDRELRRYSMFTRVDTFGADHLTHLTPDSKGAGYLKTVRDVILSLDSSKVQQVPPRVTAVEVLFDALLLDLKAIAKTARAVAQDVPGFADSFTIRDQSPAALLTTADGFISALKKECVLQHFIEHEASPDLINHLEADVAAIRNAQAVIKSGTTSAVGKTKAIGEAVRAGIKAVNYLDAIVTNKYGPDAEMMRAWQTASHIERAPRHLKKEAGATATEPKA